MIRNMMIAMGILVLGSTAMAAPAKHVVVRAHHSVAQNTGTPAPGAKVEKKAKKAHGKKASAKTEAAPVKTETAPAK